MSLTTYIGYCCKCYQFVFLSSLCFLALYCKELNDLKFKGKYASVGELQHVVYIEVDKTNMCSGAIINESWVLTAAHCFFNEKYKIKNSMNVEIVAGINDYMMTMAHYKQQSLAKEIIIHPDYRVKRLSKYDIALIQLETPFQLDLSVFYIELDGDKWPNQDGTMPRSCTASGFGLIKDAGAKNTKLKLIEVEALHGELACPCTKRYQWKRLVCLPASTQPVLCAGDSGSVLVCNNKAVAMAHMNIDRKVCSVNMLMTELNKCGKKDIVPTYMFLCPLNNWIRTYVPNVPPTPLSCEASWQGFTVFHLLLCMLITFTTK